MVTQLDLVGIQMARLGRVWKRKKGTAKDFHALIIRLDARFWPVALSLLSLLSSQKKKDLMLYALHSRLAVTLHLSHPARYSHLLNSQLVPSHQHHQPYRRSRSQRHWEHSVRLRLCAMHDLARRIRHCWGNWNRLRRESRRIWICPFWKSCR